MTYKLYDQNSKPDMKNIFHLYKMKLSIQCYQIYCIKRNEKKKLITFMANNCSQQWPKKDKN